MDELQPDSSCKSTDAKKKVALVIGAGDATGAKSQNVLDVGGHIACTT